MRESELLPIKCLGLVLLQEHFLLEAGNLGSMSSLWSHLYSIASKAVVTKWREKMQEGWFKDPHISEKPEVLRYQESQPWALIEEQSVDRSSFSCQGDFLQ